MAQGLQIHTSISELNETNMYLAVDMQTGHALLIDPSDAMVVYQWMESEKLQLDYILLTHEHYDHIAALNEIREAFHVEVIASTACSEGIQKSKINLSKFFNLVLDFRKDRGLIQGPYPQVHPYSAEKAEHTFEDSWELDWQEHKIRFSHAPGHSKGSTLIAVDGTYLFSGDTLSIDYELITGFPGGSKKEYRNVTKPLLQSLDKAMKVYPGHGRSFLLGEAVII